MKGHALSLRSISNLSADIPLENLLPDLATYILLLMVTAERFLGAPEFTPFRGLKGVILKEIGHSVALEWRGMIGFINETGT